MTWTYAIYRRDRRHVILFTATDLGEIADSLAAQRDRDELLVYATDGGFSRELNAEERDALTAALAS